MTCDKCPHSLPELRGKNNSVLGLEIASQLFDEGHTLWELTNKFDPHKVLFWFIEKGKEPRLLTQKDLKKD